MSSSQLDNFNPSGVGQANGNLFGLPFTPDTANVIILPVPWDVTVSYKAGTSKAPNAILEASPQLDFFDSKIKDAWKIGISMLEVDEKWAKRSKELREKSAKYIHWLESGAPPEEEPGMLFVLDEVNEKCGYLMDYVRATSLDFLGKDKLVGVLGGDHSTPLGLIQALGQKHEEFGILQIDAHMDLRDAYEGFKYSHASIMFNAIQTPQVNKLVQVGIRDYAESELYLVEKSKGKIEVFTDRQLSEEQFEGTTWATLCKRIVEKLPQKVYLSFDIDGLDPKYCPGTGTPVPGGLEYEQALYLIEKVVSSGRQIIGFDLCEVGPRKKDDWDANVGARLLYRISNLAHISRTAEFTHSLHR